MSDLFNENQLKLINVFVHLINIITNVEKIILGIEILFKRIHINPAHETFS